MTGQPFFPRLFRTIRPAGLAIGLLLSLLAGYDWLITFRLAVRRPLAIVPDSETWNAGELAVALARLGLPPGFFSAYALSLSLLFSLAFLACGWLILLRRRPDWFGIYLGLLMLSWANGTGVFYSIPPISPALLEIRTYLGWIQWPGLFLVLYFFPSGHVTPRWARWFAGLLGLFSGYGLITEALQADPVTMAVGFALIIPSLLIGGYAQAYRYRHAGAVERQQIKWVVLALLAYILFFFSQILLINYWRIGDPEASNPTAALLGSMALLTVADFVYIGLPVTITLAMLRHRLWDVDVIIRRTLQYSVLTGLLALAYSGGIVVLQGVFGGLTGNTNSPLITVLTTLLIAALFTPLRNRVQRFIDRRFFRAKYDAEQVLSRFASATRDEVDLDRLLGTLSETARATMQPRMTSIWVRLPARAKSIRADTGTDR